MWNFFPFSNWVQDKLSLYFEDLLYFSLQYLKHNQLLAGGPQVQ